MASPDQRFEVGDKVVHSHHGGGFIAEIQTMEVAGEEKEYYVFQSIIDESYKHFIPVESVQASSLVKVSSAKTLQGLIKGLGPDKFYLTAELNEHKKLVEDKMANPSVESTTDAIKMILSFYAKRAENGKELRQSNRAMLKRAKKILSSHVALAEDKKYDDARQYINQVVDKLVPAIA